MEKVIDRITMLLDKRGVPIRSQRRELANVCGTTYEAVRLWHSTTGGISADYVIAIAKHWNEDLVWLLTGVRSNDEGNQTQSNTYLDLPYYKNVKLSAGDGAEVPVEEASHTLKFRRDWLRQKGFDVNHLCVVVCTGESMEPALRDKDIILINLADQKIEDGRVYAVNYDGDAKVKRLFKNFDGSISIRSDNPRFTDETVSIEQLKSDSLRIIGRAVWHGGDL